jgi:splicing factor 3B subunit 4
LTFGPLTFSLPSWLSDKEWDAEYAQKVMPGVKLYGKALRVNRASQASRKGSSVLDVGANLFVGNLSPEVDERTLYDTFSRFGVILSTPKIMRDPETNEHKGFAFVQFGDFDASDAAIASLNGQYIAGRPINVQYALKKDSKDERHGSEAERMLAAQRRAQMGQQMGAPAPQRSAPPPQVVPVPPPPQMMHQVSY